MFFGGLNIQKDEQTLKSNCPHIVVGTPGRILALVRSKKLNLRNLKHFVLDECDKMLEALGNFSFTDPFLTDDPPKLGILKWDGLVCDTNLNINQVPKT